MKSFFDQAKQKTRAFCKTLGRISAALAAEVRRGNTRVIAAISAGVLCIVVVCVFAVTLSAHNAAHAVAADPTGTPLPSQEKATLSVGESTQNDLSSPGVPQNDGSNVPALLADGDTANSDASASAATPTPSPTPTATPTPTPTPTPVLKLQYGVTDTRVAKIQQRLMDLGYMDQDETTEFYGSITRSAVMLFQRQEGLDTDGIVGQETWDRLFADDAKHYTMMLGMSGDDVKELQNRLYEMGYLSSSGQLTGYFGEATEEAVKNMQSRNNLTVDGKVGTATLDLLNTGSVTPNYYSYGQESDEIKKYQNRLKELGYLTTTPDGKYGNDTVAAIKLFQARNGLSSDGYLGPSTRAALDSSSAIANALTIGSEGDTVRSVQQLLYKYNYIKSSAVTGYYGTITEAAVRLFQKNNGLSQDGQVGKQTMSVLTSGSVKKADSPVTSGSSSSSSSSSTSSSKADQLISVARSKLGCKYVRGGKGPNTFDCSGFVYWCLNQVGVNQSYITSSGWKTVGKYTKITNFNDLKKGDIIVVTGHVGIVVNGSTVIDASSSNGKVVERSMGNWWRNNFICGWRIFD